MNNIVLSLIISFSALSFFPITVHAVELPACGSQMEFLYADPVLYNHVAGLTPLGQFNGTSHILPVHINYFYDSIVSNAPVHIDDPVYSPGPLWVTAIEWNADGAGDDWNINFRPCKEVRVYYHHLNTITHPTLAARALQIKAGIDAWCDDPVTPSFCVGFVDNQVGSGDLLGTAFRNGSYALNMAVMDERSANAFQNPDRYLLDYDEIPAPLASMPEALYAEITPSRLYTSCVLNYYPASLSQKWKKKMGTPDGLISSSPQLPCGTINWDQDFSLRGVWFFPTLDENDWFFDEGNAVALIQDSVAPDVNVFNLGNVAVPTSPGVSLTFLPDLSATFVNRPFSLASRFNNVYCWQNLMAHQPGRDPASPGYTPNPVAGIILAQRMSTTQIKIQYKNSETVCDQTTMTFSVGSTLMNR
jgi:hypothetical protein